ncbi:hypothetical protein GO755_26325 [Spirosoma sp. HMF4905]|uniref:Uncharacterized protein n=1 Tax=Spirosoma arboris TaxID=2682092 RepID=A0A7K1SIF6_9BACT|nr:hypothetical protein [Spirosoma arboris]MVM33582.1 hypothetical protein [Spirosoma arboris]
MNKKSTGIVAFGKSAGLISFLVLSAFPWACDDHRIPPDNVTCSCTTYNGDPGRLLPTGTEKRTMYCPSGQANCVCNPLVLGNLRGGIQTFDCLP